MCVLHSQLAHRTRFIENIHKLPLKPNMWVLGIYLFYTNNIFLIKQMNGRHCCRSRSTVLTSCIKSIQSSLYLLLVNWSWNSPHLTHSHIRNRFQQGIDCIRESVAFEVRSGASEMLSQLLHLCLFLGSGVTHSRATCIASSSWETLIFTEAKGTIRSRAR
jgi:hypothetical protein